MKPTATFTIIEVESARPAVIQERVVLTLTRDHADKLFCLVGGTVGDEDMSEVYFALRHVAREQFAHQIGVWKAAHSDGSGFRWYSK